MDGLVQKRCNSITNLLELRLSYTKPSIWCLRPCIMPPVTVQNKKQRHLITSIKRFFWENYLHTKLISMWPENLLTNQIVSIRFESVNIKGCFFLKFSEKTLNCIPIPYHSKPQKHCGCWYSLRKNTSIDIAHRQYNCLSWTRYTGIISSSDIDLVCP